MRAKPLHPLCGACIRWRELFASGPVRRYQCAPALPPSFGPAINEGTSMGQRATPTDLELAALISSKICHDVIGPVGAIYNGLEILDEDDDEEAKNYALNVIRNVTEQASARLQFARFAFGAAGAAGALIDLNT